MVASDLQGELFPRPVQHYDAPDLASYHVILVNICGVL
jgi:hypothetical protein